VISVAFNIPDGAVPGCAGHTPLGSTTFDVSEVGSLLAAVVLSLDSEVLTEEELLELLPVELVEAVVEAAPESLLVVGSTLEFVVLVLEVVVDVPLLPVDDVAPLLAEGVLVEPLLLEALLLVALLVEPVLEPVGMLSTGPGPFVPEPHATSHTLAKHKVPNLPKIVFMIVPSQ
jgi:hypothetical protein